MTFCLTFEPITDLSRQPMGVLLPELLFTLQEGELCRPLGPGAMLETLEMLWEMSENLETWARVLRLLHYFLCLFTLLSPTSSTYLRWLFRGIIYPCRRSGFLCLRPLSPDSSPCAHTYGATRIVRLTQLCPRMLTHFLKQLMGC